MTREAEGYADVWYVGVSEPEFRRLESALRPSYLLNRLTSTRPLGGVLYFEEWGASTLKEAQECRKKIGYYSGIDPHDLKIYRQKITLEEAE